MRNILTATIALATFVAAASVQAQLVNVEESVVGGNRFYVFNVNPNGLALDTIDIILHSDSGMAQTETAPGTVLFSPKNTVADTDVLGLNTVATGWSILGTVETANDFAAAGGPLGTNITAAVDFAQLVLAGTSGGSANWQFRFADDGTQVGSTLTGCVGDCIVDPNNTPPVIMDDTAGTRPNRDFTHQFLVTDAEDPNGPFDWTIVSFTGPTNPQNFSLDPTTGLFSWDTTGVPNGSQNLYTLTVEVSDPGDLTDTGTLLIRIPEPGTCVLAGLSLIGIVASRRRLS